MGAPPRVVIGDPSPNLGEVRKEIDELTSHTTALIWRPRFEKVDRVLDVSPIAQKEVVFLTDLQAASWRPPEQGTDGLKRILARLEARRAAVGGDRPREDRAARTARSPSLAWKHPW